MKTSFSKMTKILVVIIFSGTIASTSLAGKATKWEEVPETVRATVLANGGTAGPVDIEDEKVDGKAVYEAQAKDKNGNVSDLVITEDGKLVTVKNDDAADKAGELAARAQKVLAGVKFSHPRDITHPYFPLASLDQDIMEGKEGGKKLHVEWTAKPELHKTFQIGGEKVEAFVVEDREFVDGELAEATLDYFAQDDNGTVYYLGEDVNEYKGGKVVSHDGSWLFGKDTQIPGVLLPAHLKVGDKFKPEDVSKDINESDEIVSVSETVTAPAGTYKDCVKVKEHLADGTTEYHLYASGVGVVREIPADGDVFLLSHKARKAK